MPIAPPKACATAGCANKAQPGAARCSTCESEKQKQKARDNKEARQVYNSRAWRKRSKLQLQREPLCRHCRARNVLTAATQCDHIDGNVWNWADDNLQSLCDACHARKTNAEQGGLNNARSS